MASVRSGSIRPRSARAMGRSSARRLLLGALVGAAIGGGSASGVQAGGTPADAPARQEPPVAPPLHLGETERAKLDAAMARGVAWLLARQDERGAFPPGVARGASSVATTAVALWAIAASDGASALGSTPARDSARDPAVDRPQLLAAMTRATDHLLAHRQPDGGLYDPRGGLAVYTSGIAARALRALPAEEQPRFDDVVRNLELYVYRHEAPESFVDLEQAAPAELAQPAAAAARLLERGSEWSAGQRAALEFLARGAPVDGRGPARTRDPRWRAPGAELDTFSYDDVLPIVYLPLAPEQQIAVRAYRAVREGYDLERNPDLARRRALASPGGDARGLYYYYLVLARTLAVHGSPHLTTVDGRRHDWPRELARKLLSLQQPDGRWVNADAGWWEDEPVLVTAYALLALVECRRVVAAPNAGG
ncbi:MAG: hypothetical protein JNL90_12385 [Planctomycetes bacterium]|nr:hypothetical protein [Planctomycetota bacterium]